MRKTAIIIAIAAIVALGACAPRAEALQAGSADVSLPYVDDVNEWGAHKSILTVTACGGKAELKVTSRGKRVKAVKHRRNVWTVVVRNGRSYRISVRAKGGNWKSIGYRVY